MKLGFSVTGVQRVGMGGSLDHNPVEVTLVTRGGRFSLIVDIGENETVGVTICSVTPRKNGGG